MNIVERFLHQAASRPDAPAIIETRRGRSRRITFSALDQATRQAAAMLHDAGLRAGDGVLLLQPMSIDLYVALIALFRLGLVATVFDPSAGRAHIERCCAMASPRAFIGSSAAHLLRILSPAIRRIPLCFAIGSPVPGAQTWHHSTRCVPWDALLPCEETTPALLTFTSGSTGQPKAAVRTHGFLLAQHDVLADSLRLHAGAVDLTTLPVFVLANLASGVTSVIPDADLRTPGAIAPAPVLAQLAAFHATQTAASPAFLERLADDCLRRHATLPGLSTIFTGGAPVFPHLLTKLQAAAPTAEIMPVYGSTEAEPIAHISAHEIREEDYAAMQVGKGLLAGLPVPGIRLRILRDQWGHSVGPYTADLFVTACLPVGEVGEIVVSGAHVLPGYLNGEGDAETKFDVDGVRWHRTGDAGYLDAHGRVWLLGRCAARIEDARGTLYPFSVECAALTHPSIRRVAVVSHRKQRLLVVETTRRDPDLAALLRTLAWAQLDAIHVIPRLPLDKRHNAKIDYPALHRLLDRTYRPATPGR